MAKTDQINDPTIKEKLEGAFSLMRQNNPSDAVHQICDAYLLLVEAQPEMMTEKINMPRGRRMLLMSRFPRLGANLSMSSIADKKPKIEFTKSRFVVSEALTYYEYVVDQAIRRKI